MFVPLLACLSVCELDCAKSWGLKPERERSQRHTWSQKRIRAPPFQPSASDSRRYSGSSLTDHQF